MPDYERTTVTSRQEWRAWLKANHRRDESIWLVTFKKVCGDRHVPYAECVEEALCFGWIDSRPAKLDDERSMLLLSPRKRGSPWSKLNKHRVARLIESGHMTPHGLAKISVAQAHGSWDVYNDAEDLAMPIDLARALTANPLAAANFQSFSPSSRKGILWWIKSAKRPQTREKRIAETIRLAANGVKANHPTK